MARTAEPSPITGDIAASAEVTVNTKGGSATATLKKPLSAKLGELGGHLEGAAVQFATGQGVVLLVGERAPLRVKRVGRNRFEIELAVDGNEEVDEVTAAFLRLKKDQFEKGMLDLSEPISAADLRRKTDEEFADVRGLLRDHSAKQEGNAAIIAAVKAALGDKVSDVRVSGRRFAGKAALLIPSVQGASREPHSGRHDRGSDIQPILELNKRHALVKVLNDSLPVLSVTAVADISSHLFDLARASEMSAEKE